MTAKPKHPRGRPKSTSEPTVPLRIRVPQSQFAAIHERGGVIWLHRVITESIDRPTASSDLLYALEEFIAAVDMKQDPVTFGGGYVVTRAREAIEQAKGK